MKLEAKELTRSFGTKQAVAGVSFTIEPGKILGLLGPNGAGKSTTIKMLSGQLTPTSGELIVNGKRYRELPTSLRGRIGVMPQEIIIWDDLTVEENLGYTATLQGMHRVEAKRRSDVLIEQLSLGREAKTLARDLSGGYKRRLNLAVSIIHDPQLVFLDEPSPGIDPQSRQFLWEFIRSLRDDGRYSIVLTDHYLDEAERLCDYVVIIDLGRVVAEGTVAQLKRQYGEGSLLQLQLEPETKPAVARAVEQRLKRAFKGIRRTVDGSFVTKVAVTAVSSSIDRALQIVREARATLHDLAVKEPSLEDIFLLLTGKMLRE